MTIISLLLCCRLQRLVDAHEQFKMTIGEADKEFNAIMALIQEVHRICQQYAISIGHENPYSYITGQVRALIVRLF